MQKITETLMNNHSYLSRKIECRSHPPTGGFKPKNGPKARGIGWEVEMSPTLTTDCDACSIAIVQNLEGVE